MTIYFAHLAFCLVHTCTQQHTPWQGGTHYCCRHAAPFLFSAGSSPCAAPLPPTGAWGALYFHVLHAFAAPAHFLSTKGWGWHVLHATSCSHFLPTCLLLTEPFSAPPNPSSLQCLPAHALSCHLFTFTFAHSYLHTHTHISLGLPQLILLTSCVSQGLPCLSSLLLHLHPSLPPHLPASGRHYHHAPTHWESSWPGQEGRKGRKERLQNLCTLPILTPPPYHPA